MTIFIGDLTEHCEYTKGIGLISLPQEKPGKHAQKKNVYKKQFRKMLM